MVGHDINGGLSKEALAKIGWLSLPFDSDSWLFLAPCRVVWLEPPFYNQRERFFVVFQFLILDKSECSPLL